MFLESHYFIKTTKFSLSMNTMTKVNEKQLYYMILKVIILNGALISAGGDKKISKLSKYLI